MRFLNLVLQAVTGTVLSLVAFSVMAADYPAPKEGDWVVRDFKFHTGEVMPELRLHYTTIGEPTGHTTGSAKFYKQQLKELMETAPKLAMR